MTIAASHAEVPRKTIRKVSRCLRCRTNAAGDLEDVGFVHYQESIPGELAAFCTSRRKIEISCMQCLEKGGLSGSIVSASEMFRKNEVNPVCELFVRELKISMEGA